MTLNDIIALSNAGFTAEQIGKLAELPVQQPVQMQQPIQMQQPAMMQQPIQMQQPAMMQQPVQMQQPIQMQQPTMMQQPVQMQQTNPLAFMENPAISNDPFDKILRSIGALDQSIKSNAILGANQAKQETVDDVIASIINPPTKEDEKKGEQK